MYLVRGHSLWAAFLVAFGVSFVTAIGIARADTYTYDQYGRLTGVTYSDGSSVTYTYDAGGNRTVVTQTTP